MDDKYKILLQAEIDKSSNTTISDQILKLSRGLEPLGIKLNIDNRQILNLQSQLEKITNNNTISFKVNKDGFAEIEKSVDKINDGMGNTLAVTTKYKKGTEEVLSVQGKLTTDLEKQEKIKQNIVKQEREIALLKKNSQSTIDNIVKSNDGADVTRARELKKALSDIDPVATDAKLRIREVNAEIKEYSVRSKEASSVTNSFNTSLKRFTAFYGIHEAIQLSKRAIREMTEAVLELDAAILEVQKVAEIPSMDEFVKKSYDMAESIKIVGTSFIDGVADASRMGYELNEAMDMSDIANKMVIVGDGISNVNHAMGVLQSTLALFSKEGYTAQNILDLLNQTANNTGVSFGELADMVSRNASVGLSGASLESIIALNTTLFEVTRNAESSATAINMINQRLMGLDIETGEQSLELVSKINDELEMLTGVTVWGNDGELKNTAQILEEVSEKWDTLNKSTQIATATLIGNNRHAKAVSALMSNFDTYYKSLDESSRSAGSSQKELQAYLESTTGKVEAMKGALQELFVTTMSSEMVGNIAETTTSIIKLITECGGLVPILTTISGILITIKSQKISSWILDAGKSISSLATTIISGSKAMLGMSSVVNATATATTGLGVAFNTMIPVIGLAITGISLVVSEMNKQKAIAEEIKQKNLEVAKSIGKEVSAINDIKSSYEDANKMTDGSKEKKEALISIQNELSDSYGIEASDIDVVNGKYDEQIVKLDELISKKQKAAKIVLDQNISDTQDNLSDLISDSWKTNKVAAPDMTNTIKAIQEVRDKYKDIFQMEVINTPNGGGNIDFKIMTDDATQYSEVLEYMVVQMQKYGVNSSKMFTDTYTLWGDVTSGIEAVDTATKDAFDSQVQYDINSAKMKAGITDVTKATEEQYQAMKKDIYSKYAGSMAQASQNQELLQASLSQLDSMFPQFTNSVEESSDVVEKQIKTFEELKKEVEDIQDTYANAGSAIEDLKEIQKEYDKYGAISQESMNKIVKSYPELLDAMNDEASFREKLIERIGENVSAQETALTELTLLQQQYAQDIAMIDSELYEELLQYYQTYSENYADAMSGSVEAWGVMEQSKADITSTLIEKLGIAWAGYFSKIAQGFETLGSLIPTIDDNKITHKSDFTPEQWDELSGLEKQAIKNMENTVRTGTEIGKAYVATGKALHDVLSGFDTGGIEIKIPVKTDIGGSGSKDGKGSKKSGQEKYASYIEEGLDDAIDAIKTKGDKLANEISILDEKISLTKTQGDKDKQLEYLNQMDDYYEQKKDVLINQRKDIATLTNDTLSHIKQAGIKGFSDMDMNLLDKQSLGNITREYEKQIEQANVSSNKALEADLKNKLDFIKEHGNAIISIRELKAELDQTEIQNITEQIQNKLDTIDLEFNIKTAKLDETDTIVSQLKNALEVATGLDKDTSYLNDIQNTITGVLEEEIKYNQSLIETLKEKRNVANITYEEQVLLNQQINDQLNKQSSLIKEQLSQYKEFATRQAEYSTYGEDGKDKWEKKNKDKIQALKDQIEAIRDENKEKETQAKIEEKILAIKEAEEKLEELKRNKSNQVLKKDKDGNWQFEYVADENAILDAQKDLNDKRDELDDIYEEQRKQDLINQLEDKIKLLEQESNNKNEKYIKMQDDLLKAKNKELEITMNENNKRQNAEKENMDVINQLVDSGFKTLNTTYEDQLSTILETVKRYMRQVREELAAIDEVEQKTGSGSNTGGKSSGRSVAFSLEPTDTTKFKTGGETSRTGWHWLDGNSNAPERVLSADQTKSFNKFIEMIPSLENKISKFLNASDMFTQKIPNAIGKMMDNISNNTTNNSANTVNIQNISLPNVQNGREFVDELMDVIGDLSLQAGINPSK